MRDKQAELMTMGRGLAQIRIAQCRHYRTIHEEVSSSEDDYQKNENPQWDRRQSHQKVKAPRPDRRGTISQSVMKKQKGRGKVHNSEYMKRCSQSVPRSVPWNKMEIRETRQASEQAGKIYQY